MKKVLVVDDSQVSCLMIQAIIEGQYPDWQVMTARGADEATKLSASNVFDYITLDMNMPGRDGLTVAPDLIEASPGAVIALLTGNLQERVKTQAEKLGLVFISKPVTDEKVLSFLAKHESD